MDPVECIVLASAVWLALTLGTGLLKSAVQTLPWLIVYHIVTHNGTLDATTIRLWTETVIGYISGLLSGERK